MKEVYNKLKAEEFLTGNMFFDNFLCDSLAFVPSETLEMLLKTTVFYWKPKPIDAFIFYKDGRDQKHLIVVTLTRQDIKKHPASARNTLLHEVAHACLHEEAEAQNEEAEANKLVHKWTGDVDKTSQEYLERKILGPLKNKMHACELAAKAIKDDKNGRKNPDKPNH